MAPRLVVEIVGDSSSLERSFRRSSQATANFGKDVERAGRGVTAATIGFRGLGRSIAFASGTFIGAAGFTTVVRNSINAAVDQTKILANLRNSLQSSGLSWRQYGQQIQSATDNLKKASAFDDEELFSSLQRFIRGIGDVSTALHANSVAADLARGANISLDQASKALLRAYNGQTAGLSRLGVQIKAGVRGTEALDAVQRKFSGASEAFANSAAGAQARFQVGVQDLEKAIGRGLLPQFTKLVDAAADWLNNEQNQKKVQDSVATSARNVQQAFEGVLSVVRPLAEAAKTTSDALGGLKNTLQVLTTFFVATKLVKYAAALRGVGLAAGTSAGEVGGLGAALAALPATITIVVGVEILLHKDAIQKSVDNFLRGHHLGFLTGKQLNIPANISITDLQKTRDQIAKVAGDGDFLVKALDAAIKKKQALLTGQGSAGADVLKGGRTRTPAPQDGKLFDPITKAIEDSITNAQKALKRGKAKAIQVFKETMDEIGRALTIADATPTLQDNLKLLQRELVLVNNEIKVEGKTKDLLDQRARITADIMTTQQQITSNTKNAAKEASKQADATTAANKAAARNAAQFKALGLTATGEQIVPSATALAKRGKSLLEAIKGTPLDTQKTRTELQRIAKVLSGAFGKVGRDVRQAILGMFNDISNALQSGSDKQGPLTKTTSLNTERLVAGIGLTPEQERIIRSRGSAFNSAGQALAPSLRAPAPFESARDRSQPIVVESTVNVNLDGDRVASVVTRSQQKTRRRNPRQKRGPNRGD